MYMYRLEYIKQVIFYLCPKMFVMLVSSSFHSFVIYLSKYNQVLKMKVILNF